MSEIVAAKGLGNVRQEPDWRSEFCENIQCRAQLWAPPSAWEALDDPETRCFCVLCFAYRYQKEIRAQREREN